MGFQLELSESQKQDRLLARVATLARDGWQVETHLSDSVILSRPKKIKFWLHLLLAFCTGGLSRIYVIYRVINRERESRTVRISASGQLSEY